MAGKIAFTSEPAATDPTVANIPGGSTALAPNGTRTLWVSSRCEASVAVPPEPLARGNPSWALSLVGVFTVA